MAVSTPLPDRADAVAELVLADPHAGLALAEEVAAEARAAGADEPLAVVLRAAAWAAREVFSHDRAEALLDECITVCEHAGLAERLVEALVTRSAIHLERGRTDLARADVALAGQSASPAQQAEVAFADALVLQTAGDTLAAVAGYERARDLLTGGDANLAGKIGNNLGELLTMLGQHERAEEVLADAARTAAPFRGGLYLAITANRAELALRRGAPALAMTRYAEVEQLCIELDVPLAELYREKADALSSMYLLDEAADAAAMAVAEVRRAGGVPILLVDTLLPLARAALARGRLEEAADAASEAAALAAGQQRAGREAEATLLSLRARAGRAPSPDLLEEIEVTEARLRTLGHRLAAVDAALLLGDVAFAVGAPGVAAEAWRRAADDGAGTDDGSAMMRVQRHRALAGAARVDGDVAACLGHCRAGLAELEGYRATVGSAELRSRAAAHGTVLASTGLAAAVHAGDVTLVWEWMERSRSVPVAGPTGADAQVATWLAEIRALEAALSDPELAEDGRAAARVHELGALERRVRERLWASDEGPTPGGATADGDAGGWLDRLHERLGADGALVQVQRHGEALLAVVAFGGDLALVELGPADAITQAAVQLGEAMRRVTASRSTRMVDSARRGAERLVEDLAGRVWTPLAPLLDRASDVVVVPPADLLAVPWSVLGGLAEVPVTLDVSARSWMASVDRQAASDRVVLAAGPRLEAAEHETALLAEVFPDATLLVGEAATGQAVLAAAEGAGLVHLACHGRLRTDSPWFSSIELADGPVTVHEVTALSRPAHRWVLAACELGHPGDLVGPELEGMVGALLASGAGAVVASTANLPDDVSGPVMAALHTELAAGATMARALWSARRTLDPSSPHGWAAGLMLVCYGGG
ncbi:CHAT domain-containing protein [Euzebya pacifica]|nr:CHAT domain-containing protein [Euzebya pacifica]